MDKAVNNIQDFIQDEISKLDRSIVATPQDRDHLESFAKANQGSMDLLLMQMAMKNLLSFIGNQKPVCSQ